MIVAAACDPVAPDPLSGATLDLFAEILGAEVGNLALRMLATGGIYLAGGLAAHAMPFIASATFARAFRHKGRFADLLDRVPIHVMRWSLSVARCGGTRAGPVGPARRRREGDVGDILSARMLRACSVARQCWRDQSGDASELGPRLCRRASKTA
jgi:hypothetical protein